MRSKEGQRRGVRRKFRTGHIDTLTKQAHTNLLEQAQREAETAEKLNRCRAEYAAAQLKEQQRAADAQLREQRRARKVRQERSERTRQEAAARVEAALEALREAESAQEAAEGLWESSEDEEPGAPSGGRPASRKARAGPSEKWWTPGQSSSGKVWYFVGRNGPVPPGVYSFASLEQSLGGDWSLFDNKPAGGFQGWRTLDPAVKRAVREGLVGAVTGLPFFP